MVPDDFFETNLMTNSSEAVILEGDNPLLYVDLDVFIAPATRGGQVALRSAKPRPCRSRPHSGRRVGTHTSRPHGVAKWIDQVVGGPIVDFVRNNPTLTEDVRKRMLAGIAAAQNAPPPKPVEHWTVAERYQFRQL